MSDHKAECIIPNCRKSAPAGEAFCAAHRDERRDLADTAVRVAKVWEDAACAKDATIADLTARLEAAKGDADDFKTVLHDLVMLNAQAEIGCVPVPTREEWRKAWDAAEELVRVEP